MSVRLRTVAALGAIAATVLLAGALPASAAPAAPPTTTDPADAAAGWLVRQLVDGNHLELSYAGTSYPDYGGTADAVFALAAAKTGKSAVDRAMSWLAGNVGAYTSIGDTGNTAGPYDGSVAKLALAAQVAGADPTDFDGADLLGTLQADECTATGNTDGSDSSQPLCPAPGAARNIYSSVSESLAILAEARAGGSHAPSAAAVSYFLSLQCPNGGFTGSTNACTADSDASVDETAYAAMALAALKSQPAALKSALGWLASRRASGGYWVVQGGPDVDSTGLAAAALAAAGTDVPTSRAWLVSQQMTTGPTVGKGASRGALKYQGSFDASNSVKATADGLLGLAADGSLATLTDAGSTATAPVLALASPTLTDKSVPAGSAQAVTGTGFAAGERVRAVLHSSPVGVGSALANVHGTVTVRFDVPSDAVLGAHTVELVGATSGLRATSTPFTVPAAAVTSPTAPTAPGAASAAGTCDPSALACTGRDGRQTRAEVVLGAGLLVLGAAAMTLGRRRRRGAGAVGGQTRG